MEKRNYQREMEAEIARLEGRKPTLLLHSCCGPCSSAVLEEEYLHRLAEQERLLTLLPGEIPMLPCEYDHEAFEAFAPALAEAPEGGERCLACFAMRLNYTAEQAKAHGFEYFTTTLSVSPHKNADNVNRIGEEAGKRYGVKYLFADFKKKNGYLRSLELSREYELYRQDYCGCQYSMHN